jgi:type VI secretion system protein ImpH
MSDAGVTHHDDIYGLLRDLERASPGKPRIGHSLRATDDIVRFGHAPHLSFAASTAESGGAVLPGAPAFLRVFFMGLLGPMGALPFQLSEIAIFERRYAKERPFGAFLDVLANRMIQLFYRAWADSEPAAGQDRPGGDLFQHYVGALAALADASAHDAPDRVRLALLGFAGQTAARRSPGAICDAATGILGIRTSIVEFVGAWQAIVPEDATAIGETGRHNVLGRGAILGLTVYTVQDACLVRLSFETLQAYEDHLPDASGFPLASAVLDALLPAHLDWRIEFEIERARTRRTTLGGAARLGWTSWLGNQPEGPARRDVRLRPRQSAKAA